MLSEGLNTEQRGDPMVKAVHRGSFSKTERFFNFVLRKNYLNIIAEYADKAVESLREATPSDSGKTANSWNYEIEPGHGTTTVYFTNDNVNNGVNVAVLLIYGHGTNFGGYVEGNDFVSPVIDKIFHDLADTLWKEVTK